MKIQSYTPVEENTIGEFKDIKSGIRLEDLGFALNAVSKNLYSNPIGSFIRELVSNAVDANKDNNSDKPVLVNIYEEENIWYFSVQDYGKGLSEEQFSGVYMNWFNSNKRGNNDLIGGWGIGSKSPLSYVDNYEVITINNEIEYTYSVYKAKDIPTATLLGKSNKENETGTIVKFEVKESDLYIIYVECKKQLLYFDNVVVKHNKYYYNNVYNILETDTFKYRTGNDVVEELHISLGNVPYKINFSLLGMNTIFIPVAINFETGELPVVLSRESINYEDDNINVIQLIKDKIQLVIEYITERYSKQLKFTTFKDYYKHLYREKHEANYLQLGTHRLKIDKDIAKDITGKLYFNEIGISLTKNSLETLHEILWQSGQIGNGKSYNYDIDDVFKHRYILVKDVNFNKYSDYYYRGKGYIRHAKFSKSLLTEIAQCLKFIDKDKYIPNWMYLTKKIYNEIINEFNNFIVSKYSYCPHHIKEELDSKEKDRNTYITSYNSRNNREEISLDKLNDYKFKFYIIKDENIDFLQVAHYELLFKTLPDYFKKRMTLLVIPKTTASKFKKDRNFMPINRIWSYMALHNHFNRLRITQEVEDLNIEGNLFYISAYYNKLNQELNKEYNFTINQATFIYSKYDTKGQYRAINLVRYFNEKFIKLTNNKVYKYYSNINELKKVLDFIHTFQFIYNSKNEQYNKDYYKTAIKYLIKNSKLIKINRKYHG